MYPRSEKITISVVGTLIEKEAELINTIDVSWIFDLTKDEDQKWARFNEIANDLQFQRPEILSIGISKHCGEYTILIKVPNKHLSYGQPFR